MDQKFDLQNSIKEKNNNYSIFAKCKNQNLKRIYYKKLQGLQKSLIHTSQMGKQKIFH